MAGSELTTDERKVLDALMEPDLGPADRTLNEIAARVGAYEGDVRKVLDSMEAEGLVHRDTDAKLNVEFWIALNEAAERLDPPL